MATIKELGSWNNRYGSVMRHELVAVNGSQIPLHRTGSIKCDLHGGVVSVVAFRVKGHGFKSIHCRSHTLQKPSISPSLFRQCRLKFKYTYHIQRTKGVRINTNGKIPKGQAYVPRLERTALIRLADRNHMHYPSRHGTI